MKNVASRIAAALIATTVSGALLTACGGSTDAETQAAPSGAFPVTVEHEFGATTVASEPTRIVTVGLSEQDTVLALGVQPVAVTEWYGDQPYATWPWAQDALGDARPEVLSTEDSIQFERIAALEPDLILGTNAGLTRESYDRLSAIAPTVAQAQGAPEYFGPWKDQTRLIGRAMGKADETEALIADVDTQFSDAAASHPEFADKKAIFLQNAFYSGAAIAYQNGLSTDFLTELGFVIPSELDAFVTPGEAAGGQANIPLENLSVLDVADVLLWATESPDDRAALETEPVYNSLAAVRENRQVFTDGITAGALYFTSPLSLPYVLEKLVPAFAFTLDGQGVSTTTE